MYDSEMCKAVTLLAVVLTTTTTLSQGRPASYWRHALPRRDSTEIKPVSLIQWNGLAATSCAFLLTRLSLNFFNITCSQLSQNLDTARQVARVLADTNLHGLTDNIANQYSFLILKLESEFHKVLVYQKNLLLCSGRGSELWGKFHKFKTQISAVWSLLKSYGVSKFFLEPSKRLLLNDSEIIHVRVINKTFTPTGTNEQFTPTGTNEQFTLTDINKQINAIDTAEQPTLIDLLERARPSVNFRQARHPGIIFGLGLIGGFAITQFFGSNNQKDIDQLNRRLNKQNKLVKLTNERIDILAKNVTDSFKTIKTILDKLAEQREMLDIHYAISWNFEQLITSTTNVKNEFRTGELTTTLLERGIMNPELLNLNSLNKTVTEGIQLFPSLEFPVEINRYNVPHIVKLLKIQRISHHKFVVIIPLTHKAKYRVYSLIPHPVRLDETSLVVPELKGVLLVQDDNYIIAERPNMYSFLKNNHILLTVEPIYNKNKITCDFAGFLQNATAMLTLCNFKKSGQVADTFVVETEEQRLVYFPKLTRVSFNCPDNVIKDTLIGLHKLPLACDVQTDTVIWPAKQTIALESLETNDIFTLDKTNLPIANVNKSSNVHKSLRELINKIKVNDSYTIDFDYYGLKLDEVVTYSAILQSIVTPVVIINSLILGFLLTKWIIHNRATLLSRASSINNKFQNVRDSVRSRQRRVNDSFRHKRQTIRRSVNKKLDQSPYLRRFRNSFRTPSHSDAGTNTDSNYAATNNLDINLETNKATDVYPALPRYI